MSNTNKVCGCMIAYLVPNGSPLSLPATRHNAHSPARLSASVDYGEGTRDLTVTLEAGKEYEFQVRGVGGNQVFLWIRDKTTHKGVAGESPGMRRRESIDLKKLKTLADSGDPDAMYQHANHLRPGAALERIKWYCLAAHAGHTKSQYQFGQYHHHGHLIETNLVQAHVWYTLSLAAEQTKKVAAQRELLTSKMTCNQIAKAERLFAGWEPNPDECDKYAKQADN